MINFHGWYKKKSYFEGWYLRHQQKGKVFAVIPAFHVDESGRASASIQIITNEKAYMIAFDAEEFWVAPNRFWVKIGKSIFCSKGIYLDIETEEVTAKGVIHYWELMEPSSDIMGPFKYLPFMQCKHGLLSLYHQIDGRVRVNKEVMYFSEGKGYIEKDWGSSFPSSYTWTQCNWGGQRPGCIMASAAQIPLGKFRFTGCIAIVLHCGKAYRFATYTGARVVKCTATEIILQQRSYRLRIQVQEGQGHDLKAPQKGNMMRLVNETPIGKVTYQLWKKEKVVIDYHSQDAAFESSGCLPES